MAPSTGWIRTASPDPAAYTRTCTDPCGGVSDTFSGDWLGLPFVQSDVGSDLRDGRRVDLSMRPEHRCAERGPRFRKLHGGLGEEGPPDDARVLNERELLRRRDRRNEFGLCHMLSTAEGSDHDDHAERVAAMHGP